MVGARKLPVGPSMASIASSSTFVFKSNVDTFLPLATINLLACAASSAAESLPSFFDALTSSLGTILFASKNLADLVQLVQPLRK